jgi:hypothetical protein
MQRKLHDASLPSYWDAPVFYKEEVSTEKEGGKSRGLDGGFCGLPSGEEHPLP